MTQSSPPRWSGHEGRQPCSSPEQGPTSPTLRHRSQAGQLLICPRSCGKAQGEGAGSRCPLQLAAALARHSRACRQGSSARQGRGTCLWMRQPGSARVLARGHLIPRRGDVAVGRCGARADSHRTTNPWGRPQAAGGRGARADGYSNMSPWGETTSCGWPRCLCRRPQEHKPAATGRPRTATHAAALPPAHVGIFLQEVMARPTAEGHLCSGKDR